MNTTSGSHASAHCCALQALVRPDMPTKAVLLRASFAVTTASRTAQHPHTACKTCSDLGVHTKAVLASSHSQPPLHAVLFALRFYCMLFCLL